MPTLSEPPELLTLAEAAGRLRVSPSTAKRLAANGDIPGARKIGGQWRFNAAAFDEFLDLGATG